jgi:hypothetical protein
MAVNEINVTNVGPVRRQDRPDLIGRNASFSKVTDHLTIEMTSARNSPPTRRVCSSIGGQTCQGPTVLSVFNLL